MTKEEFESFLLSKIPLSQAMQINVDEFSASGTRLVCPLAPNINDKQIAFGGSQSALAMLTAWSVVYRYHKVNQIAGEIVVRKADSRFLRPGRGDLISVAKAPDEAAWNTYQSGLKRRGIGRVQLDVSISSNSEEIFEFTGQFVGVNQLK